MTRRLTPRLLNPLTPFICPHCQNSVSLSDHRAGERSTCPTCGKEIDLLSAGGSTVEGETLPPKDSGDANQQSEPTAPKYTYDFLAPPQAPDELGRLGNYRVLKVLGAGGMGVVFQAEDPVLKRKVALKAMLPTLAVSESSSKRFVREARLAAQIEHDHIVHIYHVGEDRGVPYMAMQFLKGESLSERIYRGGEMPLADVIRIGRETALGLAAAHKDGLIHRDIKPANLWLEADTNRVKILDFGLARPATGDDAQLTKTGAVLGTPAYMAPEQANGDPVDGRCDLFSLGCVLYRLCTGELPFKGKDTMSTLRAIALVNPRPPHEINPAIPDEMSSLVMRLLAKEPRDRIASADELAAELARIDGGGTMTALAERKGSDQGGSTTLALDGRSPRPDLRGARRSHWPLLVGGVLAIATLVTGAAVLLDRTGGNHETKDGKDDATARDKDGEPKDGANPDKDGPKEKKVGSRLRDRNRYGGPTGDDREVAKWVRERGAFLLQVRMVGTPDQPVIQPNDSLPEKPFRIHTIRFDKLSDISNELNFATDLGELHRLHLIKCPIRDAALADLVGLPKLKELWIVDAELTDAGLKYLANVAGVEMLLLGGNHITSKGLAEFKVLLRLKHLGLSDNTAITDEGLEHLKDCTRLTSLDLAGTGITGKGLKTLGKLTNVTGLYLAGTRIGDEGLAHLHDGVTMLDLSKTRVTDQGLAELSRLKLLGTLKLRETKIKGTGLVHLKQIPNLRDLDLYGTEVTNDSLVVLKDIPSLKLLNLSKTPIDDTAIPHLKTLTHLDLLTIFDTNMTPAGRAELIKALEKTTKVYD